MKLKVIFDKEAVDNSCVGGWGISYLVDGKILFDTAEKADYLIGNLKALAVNIANIEKVVISHNRWNHRAGLMSLLKANSKIEVLAGSDFLTEFKSELSGYNCKLVEGSGEVAKGVYTTGCLPAQKKDSKIKEQALVLNTDNGVSLISACSQPGILTFIEKAKEMFSKGSVYAALGGFHLMDEDQRSINYIIDEIKNAGVENIGPGHCTGFNAVSIFKEIYQGHFFDLKIGQEVEL